LLEKSSDFVQETQPTRDRLLRTKHLDN